MLDHPGDIVPLIRKGSTDRRAYFLVAAPMEVSAVPIFGSRAPPAESK